MAPHYGACVIEGPPILTVMGDRKCEFDGCNALEFRTTGFCLQHKGSLASESSPLPIEKPTPLGNKLLTITIISACVAFWPILYVNDDSTGGGAAAFVMILTIPAGAAIFLVGILLANRSHSKSLKEYNAWKSREYRDTESASAKLEEIFTSTLQGEDLDRAIASIPHRLEKFEGKWDELIVWAEEKYGT